MRIVKEAEVRKNEILDAAEALFEEKGYDETSTNDIMEAVGIARGTLYHHFKSKESIMNALIDRQTACYLAAAERIAADTSIPVKERLVRAIVAMQRKRPDGAVDQMFEHLHKPQNALMHQKTQRILLQRVPPILAGILEDGIRQGIFHTRYPLECMELAMVYLEAVMDGDILDFSVEQRAGRVRVFLLHMEKLLGLEEGGLAFIMPVFCGSAAAR